MYTGSSIQVTSQLLMLGLVKNLNLNLMNGNVCFVIIKVYNIILILPYTGDLAALDVSPLGKLPISIVEGTLL